MQGSWNHDQAHYRCKYPAEYAVAADRHPKTVYVKEADILPGADEWIASLFDDDHIERTCETLAAVTGPDQDDEGMELATRRTIKECDQKLSKYRAALEAGVAPDIVGGWIEEVKLERQAAELRLRRLRSNQGMTREEIRSLVDQLKGIVAILAEADPDDHRAVYEELNLQMTYHTDGRVEAAAGPPRVLRVRVGGAIRTINPRGTPAGEFPLAA